MEMTILGGKNPIGFVILSDQQIFEVRKNF